MGRARSRSVRSFRVGGPGSVLLGLGPADKISNFFKSLGWRVDKGQAQSQTGHIVQNTDLQFNWAFVAGSESESKEEEGPFRERRNGIKINSAEAKVGRSAHADANDFHLVYERNPSICTTLCRHI